MTLLMYLQILKRWRGAILMAIVVSVITVGIRGLSEPRMYRATVTILFTPRSGGSSFGVLGQALGISGLGGESLSGMVTALIKSRRMAQNVTEHFKLGSRYPDMTEEQLWKKVSGMLDANLGERGILVDAMAEDPKLAAEMANFAVANLDAINAELSISPEKPFVKVIDSAIPPTAPVSRKILLRVLIAFLVTGGGGMVLAFFVTYTRNLMAEESRKQLEKELGMDQASLEMSVKDEPK